MRSPLLLPTNQIYKQLNGEEYLRISLEKAENELGGWRVKHCVTVTRRRGLAELGDEGRESFSMVVLEWSGEKFLMRDLCQLKREV
nr:hypothetical protein CFP56_33920 [Quercus suber]POE73500.1 hypothetical protein CFP56_33922 [Quercus suber]